MRKKICALYSSNLRSSTALHGGPQPTFQIQKTPTISDTTLFNILLSCLTLAERRCRNASLEIKVLGEFLTRLLKMEERCLLSHQERGRIREKRATGSAIIDTKRIKTFMPIAQMGCSWRLYKYMTVPLGFQTRVPQ